jgi:hypothetical protein
MTDEANQRLNEVDSQLAKLKVEVTKALRWAEESRGEGSKVGARSTVFFAVAALLALGGIGLGVFALVRKPVVSTEAIQTRKLEIRDAQGAPRIVAEGNSLKILDVQGQPRLVADEGAVRILDAKGQPRGVLEIAANGDVRLLLGPDRIDLIVNERGEPVLNLRDVMGRPRIGMTVPKDTAEPYILLKSDRDQRVYGAK